MPSINLLNRKKRDVTYNKAALQRFYQSRRWKRLRLRKLKDNPICEVHALRGIVRQTEEIHHKIPIDINHPDEDLIFDYDNLISLCIECHKEVHNSRMNPVEALIEMQREVR